VKHLLCEFLDWCELARLNLRAVAALTRRAPSRWRHRSELRISLQKPLSLPSHSRGLTGWIRAVKIEGINSYGEPARSEDLKAALLTVPVACPQLQSLTLSLVAFDLQAGAATVACLAALAERLESLSVEFQSMSLLAANVLLQ